MTLRVTDVEFRPAQPAVAHEGLLGFASIALDGAIALHGVAVRLSRDGRYVISFPARRGACGRKVPLVHPTTRSAHWDLERQVIALLRQQGALA